MLRGNGAPAELKHFRKVTDSVALYGQVSGGRQRELFDLPARWRPPEVLELVPGRLRIVI